MKVSIFRQHRCLTVSVPYDNGKKWLKTKGNGSATQKKRNFYYSMIAFQSVLYIDLKVSCICQRDKLSYFSLIEKNFFLYKVN